MRFIGVLLGSLVASAVLVAAWTWTGVSAGEERRACQQVAAKVMVSAHDMGGPAPATGVSRSEEPIIAVKQASPDITDPAAVALTHNEVAPAESESQRGLVQDPGQIGTSAAEAEAQTGLKNDTWKGSPADTADAADAISLVRDAGTEADPQSSVHWHSFWQPFSSAVSARGFAARLEQLTGLDFQVRRAGVGEYEVAFAHLDDEQRQAHLDRIQTVTGLDLERQEQEP